MTQPQPFFGPGTPSVDQLARAGGIQMYGPRFQQDPTQMYREMRAQYGPVAPVLLEGDVPAWLVLGYREVHYVTTNPQIFGRDSRRWNAWDQVPSDWAPLPYVAYQPSAVFTEGEEHQRRGGALHEALGDVDHFELRKQVEQIADELIDAFAGTGEADLMAQYALPLPLLAISRLYGMPDSDAPELVRDVMASGDSGEEAVRAHERVAVRIRNLVAEKRHRPGPDLPSRLLAHPVGFSDEEAERDLFLCMGAAQLTTADWTGNTLRLMLTDERFALTLSGHRRSIGQALNEVLWEDTPTQNFIGRWATRDNQLAGRLIRKGELVVLGLAAANTDPHVRPNSYADAVGNEAYMSFSHGEHGCPHPAREIAESIVETAVQVLLDRLPDMELATSVDGLVWRPSVWMRGLTALPVRFTPT
ncbi:MAG TPA: cytochrome P450 [Streptosporangiaceae bacterium]|jgi:cytochrome P450